MTEPVDGAAGLRARLHALAGGRERAWAFQTLGARIVAVAKVNALSFKKTTNLSRRIIIGSRSADHVTVVADAAYSRHVELGTKPHVIVPRRRRALRFATKASDRRLSGAPRRGAAVTFARRVQHPGTRPQPYLRPAIETVLAAEGLADMFVRIWDEAD